MKIPDWAPTLLLAGISAAVAWGAKNADIASLQSDVRDIKLWKDTAIQQMGNMDGKLDALLAAQGIAYQPRKK